MEKDQEFIETFNRAKAKLNEAFIRYPTEMFEISNIIEKADNYKLEDVRKAYNRLEEISNELNDMNQK